MSKRFDIGVARAEKRAREILEKFGLSSVADVDIRDLAFELGLLVQTRPIRGAEGRLMRLGTQSIAVVDTAIAEEGKRRFVAAHELGHYELHADVPMFVCNTAAFYDWHRRQPVETEANRFAAELLMPRARFVEEGRAISPSLDAVSALANSYRVSLTAAAFRYVDLNVSPSALVFCRKGYIEWSIVSDDLPLRYIGRKRAVHPYSGAGEYFQNGLTSQKPESTPVEAWFQDDTLTKGDRCLEQCRPMPNYEACLSLIWIP